MQRWWHRGRRRQRGVNSFQLQGSSSSADTDVQPHPTSTEPFWTTLAATETAPRNCITTSAHGISEFLTDLSRLGSGLLFAPPPRQRTLQTGQHPAQSHTVCFSYAGFSQHPLDEGSGGGGNREAEPRAAQQLALLFALKALRESTMSTPAPPRRWNGPGHTAGREPSQTVTEPGSTKAAPRTQRCQPPVRDARRGAAVRQCGRALECALYSDKARHPPGSARRSGAARGAGLGAAGPTAAPTEPPPRAAGEIDAKNIDAYTDRFLPALRSKTTLSRSASLRPPLARRARRADSMPAPRAAAQPSRPAAYGASR